MEAPSGLPGWTVAFLTMMLKGRLNQLGDCMWEPAMCLCVKPSREGEA